MRLVRPDSLARDEPPASRTAFGECATARSAKSEDLASHVVRPERSPLHDVRQHARDDLYGKVRRARIWFFSDYLSARLVGAHCRLHKTGGARRDRTDDLLLAKQALSQLSYGPAVTAPSLKREILVGLGRFELPTSRLSSARSNQLSYRP